MGETRSYRIFTKSIPVVEAGEMASMAAPPGRQIQRHEEGRRHIAPNIPGSNRLRTRSRLISVTSSLDGVAVHYSPLPWVLESVLCDRAGSVPCEGSRTLARVPRPHMVLQRY